MSEKRYIFAICSILKLGLIAYYLEDNKDPDELFNQLAYYWVIIDGLIQLYNIVFQVCSLVRAILCCFRPDTMAILWLFPGALLFWMSDDHFMDADLGSTYYIFAFILVSDVVTHVLSCMLL